MFLPHSLTQPRWAGLIYFLPALTPAARAPVQVQAPCVSVCADLRPPPPLSCSQVSLRQLGFLILNAARNPGFMSFSLLTPIRSVLKVVHVCAPRHMSRLFKSETKDEPKKTNAPFYRVLCVCYLQAPAGGRKGPCARTGWPLSPCVATPAVSKLLAA